MKAQTVERASGHHFSRHFGDICAPAHFLSLLSLFARAPHNISKERASAVATAATTAASLMSSGNRVQLGALLFLALGILLPIFILFLFSLLCVCAQKSVCALRLYLSVGLSLFVCVSVCLVTGH